MALNTPIVIQMTVRSLDTQTVLINGASVQVKAAYFDNGDSSSIVLQQQPDVSFDLSDLVIGQTVTVTLT